MALSALQKLGLAPLTLLQQRDKIQEKIDNLVEANNLPRWAYLESEFNTYRCKLISLLKDKALIK